MIEAHGVRVKGLKCNCWNLKSVPDRSGGLSADCRSHFGGFLSKSGRRVTHKNYQRWLAQVRKNRMVFTSANTAGDEERLLQKATRVWDRRVGDVVARRFGGKEVVKAGEVRKVGGVLGVESGQQGGSE